MLELTPLVYNDDLRTTRYNYKLSKHAHYWTICIYPWLAVLCFSLGISDNVQYRTIKYPIAPRGWNCVGYMGAIYLFTGFMYVLMIYALKKWNEMGDYTWGRLAEIVIAGGFIVGQGFAFLIFTFSFMNYVHDEGDKVLLVIEDGVEVGKMKCYKYYQTYHIKSYLGFVLLNAALLGPLVSGVYILYNKIRQRV